MAVIIEFRFFKVLSVLWNLASLLVVLAGKNWEFSNFLGVYVLEFVS